jgi:hypothetical protein
LAAIDWSSLFSLLVLLCQLLLLAAFDEVRGAKLSILIASAVSAVIDY